MSVAKRQLLTMPLGEVNKCIFETNIGNLGIQRKRVTDSFYHLNSFMYANAGRMNSNWFLLSHM